MRYLTNTKTLYLYTLVSLPYMLSYFNYVILFYTLSQCIIFLIFTNSLISKKIKITFTFKINTTFIYITFIIIHSKTTRIIPKYTKYTIDINTQVLTLIESLAIFCIKELITGLLSQIPIVINCRNTLIN